MIIPNVVIVLAEHCDTATAPAGAYLVEAPIRLSKRNACNRLGKAWRFDQCRPLT